VSIVQGPLFLSRRAKPQLSRFATFAPPRTARHARAPPPARSTPPRLSGKGGESALTTRRPNRLPHRGDVRVSGRANTRSWVYQRRLTGRLWNTASCFTAAPLTHQAVCLAAAGAGPPEEDAVASSRPARRIARMPSAMRRNTSRSPGGLEPGDERLAARGSGRVHSPSALQWHIKPNPCLTQEYYTDSGFEFNT
jgi:hypothetical protein